MTVPLQVTFRNMPPTEAIEANIREKAAKLDQFYGRVTSCRVVVEVPPSAAPQGKTLSVARGHQGARVGSRDQSGTDQTQRT